MNGNVCENIKLLSYKVAGLSNKILFPEFFKYVKDYDVFALYETWVMQDQIVKFEKYFGGFELNWKPAIRTAITGRASGGNYMLSGKVKRRNLSLSILGN